MNKKVYVVAYHWTADIKEGYGHMNVISSKGINTVDDFNQLIEAVQSRAAASLGYRDASKVNVTILNLMPLPSSEGIQID